MPNEDLDPNGKLLWDVVALRLGAQAATQAALVGRAKDLLGLTTIVATITGVILNDKLFPVVKEEVDAWWIVLAALALVVVLGAGLWALRPAEWSFAPDPLSFYAIEETYPHASQGQFYRSLAEGYLLPGADGKPRIIKNQDRLKFLSRLVVAEGWGLVALGILAFILAFLIDTQAAVTPAT
jgi:hypothetical protein